MNTHCHWHNVWIRFAYFLFVFLLVFIWLLKMTVLSMYLDLFSKCGIMPYYSGWNICFILKLSAYSNQWGYKMEKKLCLLETTNKINVCIHNPELNPQYIYLCILHTIYNTFVLWQYNGSIAHIVLTPLPIANNEKNKHSSIYSIFQANTRIQWIQNDVWFV